MTFTTTPQGPSTFYDRGRLISDIFMLINDIQPNESQTNLSVNKKCAFFWYFLKECLPAPTKAAKMQISQYCDISQAS